MGAPKKSQLSAAGFPHMPSMLGIAPRGETEPLKLAALRNVQQLWKRGETSGHQGTTMQDDDDDDDDDDEDEDEDEDEDDDDDDDDDEDEDDDDDDDEDEDENDDDDGDDDDDDDDDDDIKHTVTRMQHDHDSKCDLITLVFSNESSSCLLCPIIVAHPNQWKTTASGRKSLRVLNKNDRANHIIILQEQQGCSCSLATSFV